MKTPELPAWQNADVKKDDAATYKKAVDAFNDLLKLEPEDADRKMHNFFEAGRAMSACIKEQEDKANAPLSLHSFDVHLHTQIYIQATKLLKKPNDVEAQRELDRLTKDNPIGKPSTAWKVVGAVALFIGSALAIVGGLVLSGVAPIVSSPLAFVMIAGGVAGLTASGFSFWASREKGLSRSYTDVGNAAKKMGNTPMEFKPEEAKNTKPSGQADAQRDAHDQQGSDTSPLFAM